MTLRDLDLKKGIHIISEITGRHLGIEAVQSYTMLNSTQRYYI